MLLKAVIGLGALLMLVGFGAAGVQYMQNRPVPPEMASETQAEAAVGAAAQTWLISVAGGPVPRSDVRAYLEQDGFVPSRTAVVTRTAFLSELLQDGEKLPEAPYLQVLADIRAPMVAGKLCDALVNSIAAECAVNRARVVDGSVDRMGDKARFKIELVYRLKPSEEALPDLAAHVLKFDTINLEIEAGADGARLPEQLLASATEAATAACEATKGAAACRIMGLETTWFDNGSGAARARIAWLAPLPKGVEPAPPLATPGG